MAFNSLGSPDLKQLPAHEQPPPEWLVRNVLYWLPLIHHWHKHFSDLDPAWVLAVIAQESQGNPNAIADDVWGSTGLMQVGPRSWLGTREELLSPGNNIRVGMSMFSDILRQTEGDLRRSMALYNCGETGLDAGLCGNYGGWAYSDKILEIYVPVFRAELVVRAGENDLIGTWLKEIGYGDGFGKWDIVIDIESEKEKCRIMLPERRFRPRVCRQ